ncbi:hypothetical protein BDR26DRAFT_849942 [Obelidium mucronatum]|nr:hypothetical protein BDR26DRAFT_849942 [Obelidium mucronatum]
MLGKTEPRKLRIAVIGSGLAGLSTGHLLAKNSHQVDKDGRLVDIEVHLMERAPGSISVPCECADCIPPNSNKLPRELEHVDVRMDVPLRALFPDYYPLVIALYDSIGIPHEASDHSMSVWKSLRQPQRSPEATNTSNTYLTFSTHKIPKPVDSHLFFPDIPSLWVLAVAPLVYFARVWRLLVISWDYLRMYAIAIYVRKSGLLEKSRVDSVNAKGLGSLTLGEFFKSYKFTDEFVTGGFLPMFSVLCTCTFEETLEFPAVLVLDHFGTMGLVGKMSFVTCGVKVVCSVLSEAIDYVSVNTSVTRIERVPSTGKFNLFFTDASKAATDAVEQKHATEFDHIIFATQANQCNRVLESSLAGISKQDSEWLTSAMSVLKRFVYTKSVVVCHTDKSLMPEGPESSWKCLNFVYPPTIPHHATREKRDGKRHLKRTFGFDYKDTAQCTHYIQKTKPNLPKTIPPLFSTTNPIAPISREHVLSVSWYERAIVTLDSMKAVKDLRNVQGQRGIWFVGSFAGEGIPLLEGCMESTVDVIKWILKDEGVEAKFPGRLEHFANARG